MKKFLPLVLVIIFPLSLIGQFNYFIKDTTIYIGKQLQDNGKFINQKNVQIRTKSQSTEFSPYNIEEYGFKDGRIYYSRLIPIGNTIKRVFLLQLVKGKTNAYIYYEPDRKIFFTEKDDTLLTKIPIDDHHKLSSFRDYLKNFTADCPEVKEASMLVSPNEKSFSKFINQYNKCEYRYFPHFRYGVLLGIEVTKLVSVDYYSDEFIKLFDFKPDVGYSLGGFIDSPILVSDFSIHIEASFSHHHFLYGTHKNNTDYDFSGDLSTLKIPFMLRYTYPFAKIKPLVNFGIVGSINVQNNYNIFAANIIESVIEIKKINKITQLQNYQLGYSAGVGVEYKLNYHHSLFFELRTIRLMGIADPNTFNLSNIIITTAINF